MLSDKGNPTIENMSQVMTAVQKHEGVELNVGALS